jgi:hypothetical protein
MTHSIHNWGDLQIHFSIIFWKTRPPAYSHLTSVTPIHSSLYPIMRTTPSSAVGYMISLVSVCYGDSRVAKYFLTTQHLIPNGWQQQEFHWLLPPQIWIFPWISLRHLQWSALFSLLCMTTQLQKPNTTEIRTSSTVTVKHLKLRCDYCIKFHLFEGTQDVFSRLTVVCWMLLPHNPYRLPQHYERHTSMSSPVVVNIDFCGYIRFLCISFVWSLWVQYATDNLSRQQTVFISNASVDTSTHIEVQC